MRLRDVVENLHPEVDRGRYEGFRDKGQDWLDFESVVWDFDPGNSNVVRGLNLGHRRAMRKKERGRLRCKFPTTSHSSRVPLLAFPFY